MFHDDSDVSSALKRVAPDPAVPSGFLDGARRRRARSRATTGAVAGIGALAVAVGIVGPGLGPGAALSTSDVAARHAAGSEAGSSQASAVGSLPDQTNPADLVTAARAAQRVGWDAVLGAGPGNQVVSPSSLSISLAMAAEGAEGASLTSIDSVLGLSGEARSAAYSGLRESLSGYETAPDRIDLEDPPATPKLHLAARLVTIDKEAEAPFVERLGRWFGAPLVETTHDQAKGVLDEWARSNTGGLIRESAIEVVPELRLVTQDALLFSAAWAVPFTVGDLQLEFDGAGTVKAMQGVVPARYAEGERWTAVRLAYDDRLAADVILPSEGVSPADLTAAELEEASAGWRPRVCRRSTSRCPNWTYGRRPTCWGRSRASTSATSAACSTAHSPVSGGSRPSCRSPGGHRRCGAHRDGVYESAVQSDHRLVVDRGYAFRVVDTDTGWPLFLASVVDPGSDRRAQNHPCRCRDGDPPPRGVRQPHRRAGAERPARPRAHRRGHPRARRGRGERGPRLAGDPELGRGEPVDVAQFAGDEPRHGGRGCPRRVAGQHRRGARRGRGGTGRAFGALRQSLLGYEDLPGSVSVDEPPSTPVVHLAGQVVAIDRPVNGDFLDRLATYYDTGATQVARADAKAVLDAWVERNTAGLIERSAVEVRPDTLAVLQDALLFAAAWRDAFEEASVEFAASSGAERVDAVADTVTARYAEGDGWVAVRLAYDDALAADVILPAADPESLSSGDLAAVRLALDAAAEERVAVTMPAFDLKGKTDLIAALPEIDLSDLGGIADGATGDQWVQQVRLQVGARGTVGAAVTEVAVGAGAPAPEEAREFIVDRPYVLRVLDTRTGWPLFLTLIGDPAA
ncbi:serpin family protein [Tessaracoccus sp. HDW20]|uniref:serpin family protein n=1 Tax=Tessaracoccus coleopterorum TaxID=2714950 RepID=UPI0018D45C18|nr:serpin family protein [Tessaracoccus coleopterorum]NHB84561.1 serpin family protein [Tessaracoccus coleopterorum]